MPSNVSQYEQENNDEKKIQQTIDANGMCVPSTIYAYFFIKLTDSFPPISR